MQKKKKKKGGGGEGVQLACKNAYVMEGPTEYRRYSITGTTTFLYLLISLLSFTASEEPSHEVIG